MLIKPILAFLFGGLLCALSQVLIDKTGLTPARILTSFVVVGVILGAVGIYDPLFKTFGTGISLLLFGFGGNIASGVREAVMRDGIWGILTGALTAASAGIATALVAGLVAAIFSRGKAKRM